MITLITGAPGTGKTAALVSLLSDLSKDRAVYVNGIPDLKIQHQELDDPTTWPQSVPDGSIVVIDEVQRIWRPRGPGAKVPSDIAALETHRHRGLDFYVITQSPKLCDSNVRGLVGRHVHLRDLGILGRFWYEWPECSDQCSSAWRGAPIKKRYRLPKAIFASYKSASEHIKPLRSFPWMLVLMVSALLLTIGLAWRSVSVISGKINPATNQVKPSDSGLSPKPVPAPEPGVAYDYTAFVPRVSNRPESAPAYDRIRVVSNMPTVSGCVRLGSRCKCYSGQGTDAGLTAGECKAWLDNPPFDPYRVGGGRGSESNPVQTKPVEQSNQSDKPANNQKSLTVAKNVEHADNGREKTLTVGNL